MALKFKQLEEILLSDLSLRKTKKIKAPTIRYHTSPLDFGAVANRMGIEEKIFRYHWQKKGSMNPKFFEKILSTLNISL